MYRIFFLSVFLVQPLSPMNRMVSRLAHRVVYPISVPRLSTSVVQTTPVSFGHKRSYSSGSSGYTPFATRTLSAVGGVLVAGGLVTHKAFGSGETPKQVSGEMQQEIEEKVGRYLQGCSKTVEELGSLLAQTKIPVKQGLFEENPHIQLKRSLRSFNYQLLGNMRTVFAQQFPDLPVDIIALSLKKNKDEETAHKQPWVLVGHFIVEGKLLKISRPFSTPEAYRSKLQAEKQQREARAKEQLSNIQERTNLQVLLGT